MIRLRSKALINQSIKSNSMIGFSEGKIKCLVTKPSIAGFGMNWQNCHNNLLQDYQTAMSSLSGCAAVTGLGRKTCECVYYHFCQGRMRKREH